MLVSTLIWVLPQMFAYFAMEMLLRGVCMHTLTDSHPLIPLYGQQQMIQPIFMPLNNYPVYSY